MYLEYFGLKNRPFQINTDSTMLWLGEKHREALATLKYGVFENKGFLLLTGDIGTGKTTLINALIGNLGKNVICSTISNPGMEKLDFLNYIANAFHIKKKFNSKGEFVIYFSHFLRKARENKKRVLLIVDESQKLTQELLDEIRLLSNIEIPNSKLINIFFIGQNEFNVILNKSENAAVKQRITLNYNLKPLTKKETYQYIQYRLKICGSQNHIFKKEAIEEIYNFSNGIPRKINILCDHALLTGYVKGKKKIDKSIIIECADEIEIKISDNESEKNEGKNIQPKKGRSFAKAAVYLSVFMIAWSIIGLFYYNNNGYSFDNVGKYLTQSLNGIKSKIFTGISIDKSEADIKEISTRQKPVKENENNLNQLTASNEKGLSAQKKNRIKDVMKENPESDLQNRLESLGEVIESKEIATETTSDSKIKKENLLTLAGVEDSETERNDAVVKNAAFIDQNNSMPHDLSTPKIKSKFIGEENSGEKIQDNAENIPNKNYAIYFDYNSKLLTPDGTRIIQDMVEIIRKNPNAVLIVKGHTDNSGYHETNITLSQKRANIVKNYLIQKGIHYNRIETKAFGDSEPIARNDNSAGRRINRRVEIEILNKG